MFATVAGVRVALPDGVITWDTEGGRAKLFLGRSQDDGSDRYATRIDFLADRGRLRLLLWVPPVDRPLDVSRNPGVVRASLTHLVVDAEPAELVISGWIRCFAAEVGAWHGMAAGQLDLTMTTSGVVFPVLGSAYDRGASALAEIPAWAAPGLAQSNCTLAAQACFGSKASRRVVAALAASLMPADRTDRRATLAPLFLALAGQPLLEADQLALVLTRAAGCRADCATWSASDLARMRRMLAGMRRKDATSLLADTAREEDGVARFLTCSRLVEELGIGRPKHLPARLGRVEARLARQRAKEFFSSPPVQRTRTEISLWQLADIDGQELGNFTRLRRPRGAPELKAWGSILRNCLADYVPAWTIGRSVLIGVEKYETITYCLELSPERVIRQFRGRNNSRVPDEDALRVLRALSEHGVVPVGLPANRAWLVAEGYPLAWPSVSDTWADSKGPPAHRGHIDRGFAGEDRAIALLRRAGLVE